jgi:hypothetical protein
VSANYSGVLPLFSEKKGYARFVPCASDTQNFVAKHQQAVEMVASVGTILPLFVFDQAQHNSGII